MFLELLGLDMVMRSQCQVYKILLVVVEVSSSQMFPCTIYKTEYIKKQWSLLLGCILIYFYTMHKSIYISQIYFVENFLSKSMANENVCREFPELF